MPWKWYDSRVIRIEDASPTTKRFWVEVETEDAFSFRAGQFVTMDLPISDKRLKRWRSYSIANHPNADNVLEFCVVRLAGGTATKYLFEDVSIGTSIRFKGPSGTFVLPEQIDHDLIWICTGTGVAPFRSMLYDLVERQQVHRRIHLIFGSRYEEGILYRSEFEAMRQSIPEFEYSVALSRDTRWAGVRGYVHQIYLDAYKEVRPDRHFYLCGWTNMVDEAAANLVAKLGYAPGQIHYELYG